MERTVHQAQKSRQAKTAKPRASASFDARRLASFRMLLASSQSDGSSRDYVDRVEAECRSLAEGLIAGFEVEA